VGELTSSMPVVPSCTVMIHLEVVGDILILTSSASKCSPSLQLVGTKLYYLFCLVFTATRIFAVSWRSKWRMGLTLILGLINPAIATVRHIRTVCHDRPCFQIDICTFVPCDRQYTFILYKPYPARLAPHYQTCDIDMSSPGNICV